MRAAIERGKRRIDGAPAERADLALDHNATLWKYEIRTIAAAFVVLWVVLIPGGGLYQLLLILRFVILRFVILRFVILGFSSRGAATGRGGGDSAHCLEKSPPRRSGSRHGS